MSDEEYEYQVAHVVIDEMPERPRPKEYTLQSTIHTYIIDPAGLNGPNLLQVVGYDPSLHCIRIQAIDAAVIAMQDMPSVPPPIPSTSTNPPPGSSIHVINNAAYHAEIYGDQPLWLVAVTGQVATRVSVIITRRAEK